MGRVKRIHEQEALTYLWLEPISSVIEMVDGDDQEAVLKLFPKCYCLSKLIISEKKMHN